MVILSRRTLTLALSLLLLVVCQAQKVYDFSDYGKSGGFAATAKSNTAAWNSLMDNTGKDDELRPGDTLLFPSGHDYYFTGGVSGYNLTNVTIVFDSNIYFGDMQYYSHPKKFLKNWPREEDGKSVLDCMTFTNFENVTFTSNNGPSGALIDGMGPLWWGIPFIGYLRRGENRPKLFVLHYAKDVLFENILLKDSPYWSFYGKNSDGLEVAHSTVDVRRAGKDSNSHSWYQLSAFNTDGFDVSGKNVWIHDVNIWNQDDCIAVKPNSENMLFERVNASGLGLTIGSIGKAQYAKNITFRNCTMHKTVKGIYVKFNQWANENSTISDVTYENIVMEEPKRAIWIGPAQQSDSANLCAAHPCSLCWPLVPGAKCSTPKGVFADITLRNIVVNNPKKAQSVILGNDAMPMANVMLNNVNIFRTTKKATKKTKKRNKRSLTDSSEDTTQQDKKLSYYCPPAGVKSGRALGFTTPVPGCVADMTKFASLEEAEQAEIESVEIRDEL